MSAPNIVRVSEIFGRSKGARLTSSEAPILVNQTGSGRVMKVNAIRVTNIDGSSPCSATVSVFDHSESASYKIASTIPIPANAALSVIDKSTSIYLEEGDEIRASATANDDLDLVISWEEIT